MLVKTKAIVISSLRHQEKNLIVRCFTASDGIKSYYVQNAFGSKKGNQKIGYFQPLTLLEIEASHKNKGTLERLKEVKLAYTYQTVHTHFMKSTLSLFIAEMLYAVIREEEKNEALFDYLESALLWFDVHDQVVNFHLKLMLDITKFLGFYPDDTAMELPKFNLLDGQFSTQISSHSLTEKETILFKKLMNLSFDDANLNFNVSERQALLKILLSYFHLHIGHFKTPKSIAVLKEVFS